MDLPDFRMEGGGSRRMLWMEPWDRRCWLSVIPVILAFSSGIDSHIEGFLWYGHFNSTAVQLHSEWSESLFLRSWPEGSLWSVITKVIEPRFLKLALLLAPSVRSVIFWFTSWPILWLEVELGIAVVVSEPSGLDWTGDSWWWEWERPTTPPTPLPRFSGTVTLSAFALKLSSWVLLAVSPIFSSYDPKLFLSGSK